MTKIDTQQQQESIIEIIFAAGGDGKSGLWGHNDKRPINNHITWAQAVEVFMAPHAVRGDASLKECTDKKIMNRYKNGPYFCPSAIKDGVDRGNDGALSIDLLVFDFDGLTAVDMSLIWGVLKPFEYVAMTSYSHLSRIKDYKEAWRVVLPWAKTLTPSEYKAAWPRAAALVYGMTDPACKDPMRLFYLPATYDPAIAQSKHNQGRWISVDDLPVELPDTVPAQKSFNDHTSKWGQDRLKEWGDLVDDTEQGARNNTWNKTCYALGQYTAGGAISKADAERWIEEHTNPDERRTDDTAQRAFAAGCESPRRIKIDVAAPVYVGLDAALMNALKLSEQRQRKEALPVPLPTEWAPLAEHLHGGLWPGLTILVGGTGTGKTAFALQAALAAAKAGFPVLYGALEIESSQIACRLVAMHAGFSWSQLYYGGLNTEEQKRAMEASARLAEQTAGNLHIADFDPAALDSVLDHAASLGTLARPCLFILDFLQLVGLSEDERRMAVGVAGYKARLLAKNNPVAVLALSSTAREHYPKLSFGNKDDEKTVIIHLSEAGSLVGLGKESGEIEFACDNLLVLGNVKQGQQAHRAGDDLTFGYSNLKGGLSSKLLVLAKVRAGMQCLMPMTWDGASGKFEIVLGGGLDIPSVHAVKTPKLDEFGGI